MKFAFGGVEARVGLRQLRFRCVAVVGAEGSLGERLRRRLGAETARPGSQSVLHPHLHGEQPPPYPSVSIPPRSTPAPLSAPYSIDYLHPCAWAAPSLPQITCTPSRFHLRCPVPSQPSRPLLTPSSPLPIYCVVSSRVTVGRVSVGDDREPKRCDAESWQRESAADTSAYHFNGYISTQCTFVEIYMCYFSFMVFLLYVICNL